MTICQLTTTMSTYSQRVKKKMKFGRAFSKKLMPNFTEDMKTLSRGNVIESLHNSVEESLLRSLQKIMNLIPTDFGKR